MGLFSRTPASVGDPDPPEPVTWVEDDFAAESAVEPEPELEYGRYDGPRCWVHQDTYSPQPDGSYRKDLDGGWHYSTRLVTEKYRVEVQAEGEEPEVREWESTREVPDRKLHLNDDHPEETSWFYEYAEPHHQSWVAKHGVGKPLPIPPLHPATEHPPEAHDSHPGHEQFHRDALAVDAARGPR